MNQNHNEFEPQAIESPSTELTEVLAEGNFDNQLAMLERKAELADRHRDAINTILLKHTYPQDWQEFDGTMCLSSAGAERVGRIFDYRILKATGYREEINDGEGKGYRYVFEGRATMDSREIYAQGSYSTRDNFLGKKGGQWRSVEEINENHIRNAAYHIFIGNSIKALLGLRGIPVQEFEKMMQGQRGKSTKVEHATGSQGGAAKEDTALQSQLSSILMGLANSCYQIEVDEEGKHAVDMVSDETDPIDIAKHSCKALTSFKGRDGKLVSGIDSIKKLNGKRLEIAVQNAQKVQKGIDNG